jgi:hypothetical protein
VCGGVLLLPFDNSPNKKFNLPYINGQFIVPILLASFMWIFKDRLGSALTNIANESHQEYLFLIFMALAIVISIYTFIKKWSLIPVLGLLFCTYLMIEIPVKSWKVFFGWMGLGLAIYFTYGFNKSKLSNI